MKFCLLLEYFKFNRKQNTIINQELNRISKIYANIDWFSNLYNSTNHGEF